MITTDSDMSARTSNSLCLISRQISTHRPIKRGEQKKSCFPLFGTLMLSPKITAGFVSCFEKNGQVGCVSVLLNLAVMDQNRRQLVEVR